MDEDQFKALNARIETLEELLRSLIHSGTPQGRFEAEQDYDAFRKSHNPLYGSTLGPNVDDPLTQVENVAREADPHRPHIPVTAPGWAERLKL